MHTDKKMSRSPRLYFALVCLKAAMPYKWNCLILLALQIVERASKILDSSWLKCKVLTNIRALLLYYSAPRSWEAIMPAVETLCEDFKDETMQMCRVNFQLDHGTCLDVCDVKYLFCAF